MLALAKTRFNHDRLFARKPLVPEEHKFRNQERVYDNFLRPRQHKRGGGWEEEGLEQLEPWGKSEEFEQGGFDIE